MTREKIFSYVKKKYGVVPEYLWEKWPSYSILRRSDNRKWFAAIMNVPKNRIGISNSVEPVDILNVKCEPFEIEFLREKSGFLPAYHMNKKNWITILLNESVGDEEILNFIDVSYAITRSKK